MNKYSLWCASLLISGALHASVVDILGETPVKIKTGSASNSTALIMPKTILVQKIKLSSNAKLMLKQRVNELQFSGVQRNTAAISLPIKVNLGMNKTPVLDQGAHGTCVTFAVTGAIDAALGKGDYISQLCPLELGNYLVKIKKPPYPYSGWNGTWGSMVRGLLGTYGLITKPYQLKYGCPQNVKQYPMMSSPVTSKIMTIAAYTAASVPVPSSVLMKIIADVNVVFGPNYNAASTLLQVKQNLKAGKRVVIGFLLDETQGSAGAVGTKVRPYDTWVMNAAILKKVNAGTLGSGHEVIIYGYDDSATARGSDGKTSKGLLFIMNSWGPYAGDKGTYYMSYDYFLKLHMEAMIIGPK